MYYACTYLQPSLLEGDSRGYPSHDELLHRLVSGREEVERQREGQKTTIRVPGDGQIVVIVHPSEIQLINIYIYIYISPHNDKHF